MRTRSVRRLTYRSAIDSSPAWSPDGTEIAFYSNAPDIVDDIWVIHPDGSGLRVVTHSDNYNTAPSWSPDGTKLVFQKEYWIGHDTDLYTTYPDGVGEERIVQFDSSELSPAWQPLR